jgi:hypothetical protein
LQGTVDIGTENYTEWGDHTRFRELMFGIEGFHAIGEHGPSSQPTSPL